MSEVPLYHSEAQRVGCGVLRLGADRSAANGRAAEREQRLARGNLPGWLTFDEYQPAGTNPFRY